MTDQHEHSHDHSHGNERDKGRAAMMRYIRIAPRMWRSDVNDAVVDLIAPTPNETVVDIGAGVGAAVVRASALGATVIAVEPTPYMRRVLSWRRAVSKHRKHIIIRDGSAEALPLSTDEADAVWAVNTMHHWNNPESGAAEIARVLKPGGRLVLVDENFADPRHPNSAEWHERHADDDHHGFSMVDAAAVGNLMTAAGLVDIVAEERDLAGRPVISITGSGAI